jgi:hypothetical protein
MVFIVVKRRISAKARGLCINSVDYVDDGSLHSALRPGTNCPTLFEAKLKEDEVRPFSLRRAPSIFSL